MSMFGKKKSSPIENMENSKLVYKEKYSTNRFKNRKKKETKEHMIQPSVSDQLHVKMSCRTKM
jgi:hypothetical protein